MQEHGSLKEVMKVLRAKMAEHEKKSKTVKKGGKSKSKKAETDEEEDEAMESEEEQKKPAPKGKKAKSKMRIESDDEAEGSDPWDDIAGPSSPARTSSPLPPSSPVASSEAGMKLDEEDTEKQEDVDEHKMEEDSEPKKEDDPVPKKPAAARRGGIQVPEYYPWEEAKKLFLHPDVTPADQVDVCAITFSLSLLRPLIHTLAHADHLGGSRRRRTGPIFGRRKRI